MADRTCGRCGKAFRDPSKLRRHLANKRPCDPIIEREANGDQSLCKYCGRAFASKTSMYRHVRQSCKIANSEEGMEKLMEHTLQRQLAAQTAKVDALQAQMEEQSAQMEEQSAQMAELTALEARRGAK